MSNPFIAQFQSCSLMEQILIFVLTLHDGNHSSTHLHAYLKDTGLTNEKDKPHSLKEVQDAAQALRERGLLQRDGENYFSCRNEVRDAVLQVALSNQARFVLKELALQLLQGMKRRYGEIAQSRKEAHSLAMLRLALLTGQTSSAHDWAMSATHASTSRASVWVQACSPTFFSYVMQYSEFSTQEIILRHFLETYLYDLTRIAQIRQHVEAYLQRIRGTETFASDKLQLALAEHYLWCGRLNEAWNLVMFNKEAQADLIRASIDLLRGESAEATKDFEAALKALRKESGSRNAQIAGLPGCLYVLAMICAPEGKKYKAAQSYLAIALRTDSDGFDAYQRLDCFLQNQITGDTQQVSGYSVSQHPLTLLCHALMAYWLDLPADAILKNTLNTMATQAKAAGLDWLATQALVLLGETKQASALLQQHHWSNLSGWFERKEAWQQQLEALLKLAPPAETAAIAPPIVAGETRLVWDLSFSEQYGIGNITPIEQKRNARGEWTAGRNVALKRLATESANMDFLSIQDLQVVNQIVYIRDYYNSRYELRAEDATPALVNHPLLMLDNVQAELLPGTPQLVLRQQDDTLSAELQPDVPGKFKVVRETPTRLRLYTLSEKQRQIRQILAAGFRAPTSAKAQLMAAMQALSRLINIQSEITGVAGNVPQVACDTRLHLHLWPHQHGLKLKIQVCPIPDSGLYYQPGYGGETIMADVNGKPMQTRRTLLQETKAVQQLLAECSSLQCAEQHHWEWHLKLPEDCLEFLSQLQELGAERVVLAWPEGEAFKLRKPSKVNGFHISIKSLKDWFSTDASLTVSEEQVLSLSQLLSLLQNSPGRFIPMGNNEFLALSESLRQRLDDLANYAEIQGETVKIHPLASFALEELLLEASSCKSDAKWKAHQAHLTALDSYQPQLPSTLQAELRDYQLAGFNWLSRLAHWGVGACLADDMGLGKTLQAIALIVSRAAPGPTLVVAPTSVCPNWISEISRFAPTLKPLLFGSGDRQQTIANAQAFEVHIVSYGLLQQEAELFSQTHWHTIVLDEAQAIKNAQTKRSQVVMSLQGDFKILLTGTPLENHLGELWNLYRFINPGLLGSQEQFNRRFANPIERGESDTERASARHRLRRLIQPFMLRRSKTQVLTELPSRTEIAIPVALSEAEATLYETLRRQALAKLANESVPPGQRHLEILGEIMKLRRTCCNPNLTAPELGLSSSKLSVFADLLSNLLSNHHKVLVFSQFVDHLTLIRQHLEQQNITYQYLDGSTPMATRKTSVDAFQAGQGDVFLISLKAGGTGINLTAADYVIHMDPWWNPAVEDQASDRAHRMGQRRPVTIYRLVTQNTIEERIVQLHQHKRDLADSLLDGGDLSAKMSASEMLALLQEGRGE